MASILARTRILKMHALPSCARHTLSASRRAGIHTTQTLHKKKAQSPVSDAFDDAYGEDVEADDLFMDPSAPSPAQAKANAPYPSPSQAHSPKVPKAPKARRVPNEPTPARLARFEEVMAFVEPRVGKDAFSSVNTKTTPAANASPAIFNNKRNSNTATKKHGPPTPLGPIPRRSAWSELLSLAVSEEQLMRIVRVVGRHMDNSVGKGRGNGVSERFGVEFALRCHTLRLPTPALTLFSTPGQSHIPLTLPAAQILLHALHLTRPLADTLRMTQLYTAWGLPGVSEDLASAVMVAGACLKELGDEAIAGEGKEQRLKIVDGLVPSIRTLFDARMSTDNGLGMGVASTAAEARVNKWILWGLVRMNKGLRRLRGAGAEVVQGERLPRRVVVRKEGEGGGLVGGEGKAVHLNVYA